MFIVFQHTKNAGLVFCETLGDVIYNVSTTDYNKFVVLGRGGLPQNPNYSFNGSTILVSLLDLIDEGKIRSSISPQNNRGNYDNQSNSIIEATGFIRNSKGEIELVAVENTPLTNKIVSECSS